MALSQVGRRQTGLCTDRRGCGNVADGHYLKLFPLTESLTARGSDFHMYQESLQTLKIKFTIILKKLER